jgi:hypothetical protein
METEHIKRKDNHTVRATIALLMVGLLSACLVGCATPGRSYDDGKVAMIKKDVTTEAELVDWFGPPTTRAMGSDGAKALRWTFSPAKGHVEVKLGPDGKVTAYSASAESK